jgi:catalase
VLETRLDRVDSFLTPTKLFYARSHSPAPQLELTSYGLQIQSSDKNYLFDALIASIHNNPLQWHLVITVGQPRDPTNDAVVSAYGPPPDDTSQIIGAMDRLVKAIEEAGGPGSS